MHVSTLPATSWSNSSAASSNGNTGDNESGYGMGNSSVNSSRSSHLHET
jgi:hypothetical protein